MSGNTSAYVSSVVVTSEWPSRRATTWGGTPARSSKVADVWRRPWNSEGKEHRTLNQNVLIEIGAAMALYGRSFILLVEKDVTLPSNLQGLYEVRYSGTKLDYDATMKLLKAFNDFRS
jgi:hypothetical protein